MVVVDLDHVRLTNPLNGNKGGHWAPRAKRAKMQRGIAAMTTRVALKGVYLTGPTSLLTVTITRIAPGTLDSDALPASGKHVRDGVADALGVPDNDPRIEWKYVAEKSKAGHYAVRITIERREAA